MKLLRIVGLSLVINAAHAGTALASEPALGIRGAVLLSEDFEHAGLPGGWSRNTGVVVVREGVLHASEVPADQHVGAFRKSIPVQDAVVQLDFRLQGATTFHVGFDPAPGQLKKKGHLFSVIITAAGWSIMEHNDKSDSTSKNKVHAKAVTAFSSDRWYSLTLQMKGTNVVVTVDGKEPLRATAADFKVKKPGLVFRVGGKAGQEVLVDNVRVWELN